MQMSLCSRGLKTAGLLYRKKDERFIIIGEIVCYKPFDVQQISLCFFDPIK
jgi:hypothetical protein